MTSMNHCADTVFAASRVEDVFQRCFLESFRTRLQGGASEPFYRPAGTAEDCNALYYREDFFASALHEVAHWCIAGSDRRKLADFGYWYEQDGRDSAQQHRFEAVESRPQALEWIFSRACGWRFQMSLDNLESVNGREHVQRFAEQIVLQATNLQLAGLPPRAETFRAALRHEFRPTTAPGDMLFQVSDLL